MQRRKVPVGAQNIRKAAASAEDAAFDRAELQTRLVGDLVIAEAAKLPQEQHLPRIVRQLGER